MIEDVKYHFSQIGKQIYQVKFENEFDVAMTFLRVSEFKEDPNLFGKFFSICEFMRSYASRNEWIFSYPQDWCGFNLTDDEIKKIYFSSPSKIPDFNEYDQVFLNILKNIPDFNGDGKYAIFGFSPNENDKSIDIHEITHAIFYLDEEYKEKVKNVINDLKFSDLVPDLRKHIVDSNYEEHVVDDEINAYFSTGLAKDTQKFLRVHPARLKAPKMRRELKKLFQEVYKKWVY